MSTNNFSINSEGGIMRKFQVYTYALMIGTLAFLNLKCERMLLPVDSSKKIDYMQGNTEANVVIRLFDNYTKAPIPGTKVSIIGVDTLLSDTTGAVFFDSIKVGTYIVNCSKNGFESIYDELKLTIDSNSNTVPIVNQSSDFYYMAKKGAVVRGNLFYQKDGKYYQANGATVECRLNNISFQNPVRTTTSAKGVYSFADLPEYTSYTITVRPFSDGSLNYKQSSELSCAGKSAGDTIRAEDIILAKFTDGKFIVMNHNLETLTKSDSIVLEFSESVNIEKLGADSIYVNLNSESARILTQKEWQNDNKRLVIRPFDGAWDPTEEYTLVVKKIVSTTGKPLDNTSYLSRTFTPITSGELGNVKNVRFYKGAADTSKIDYNTNSITLKWSPLANALGYQIYQKTSSDSTWTHFESVIDTILTVTTTGSFNSGKYLKFIVLGVNSTGISSFKSATILTLRDEKAPRIVTATLERSNFDNSTINYVDTVPIPISNIYLPEPMDTTKKPTIKVTEASYYDEDSFEMHGDSTYSVSAGKVVWIWTSNQSGILKVVVDRNKDASYDTLKIDFSTVTDVAGNKADMTSGAGYINIYTLP